LPRLKLKSLSNLGSNPLAGFFFQTTASFFFGKPARLFFSFAPRLFFNRSSCLLSATICLFFRESSCSLGFGSLARQLFRCPAKGLGFQPEACLLF
jgi:hypothetical protein